ncbi:hypothetical protein AB0G02_01065 [Actinosynnema sp. NPDC023658]|uniref:hypothetical protein n=1 Tax=Actinosynnema sp. NPDC023658 TaxID=3155465 RepID=UPI0033D7860D
MRRAFVLWVTAVAAGVFETVVAVSQMIADGSGSAAELTVGISIRVVVFTAAVLVAARMRAGRQWARVALVLGLGVLGVASMVVEPLVELLRGERALSDLLDAGVVDLAFFASRVVHVTAVYAAVVLMFRPAANAYFRAVREARAVGV